MPRSFFVQSGPDKPCVLFSRVERSVGVVLFRGGTEIGPSIYLRSIRRPPSALLFSNLENMDDACIDARGLCCVWLGWTADSCVEEP